MANIISQKVNDKISHLMKLRREVLNDEGPNSKNPGMSSSNTATWSLLNATYSLSFTYTNIR